MTLNWRYEKNDIIGLFIPSTSDQCQYRNQREFRVGELSDTSARYYVINKTLTEFSEVDYSLEEGNAPAITITTGKGMREGEREGDKERDGG